jgi:hypothetical protein
MTSPAKSAACLLPFLLTGCVFHKTNQARTIPYAPDLSKSATLQLVSVELPPAVTVIQARPIYNMREAVEPIREPVRHKKPANKSAEEAAMEPMPAPVPAISAIGQLSSGDQGDFRRQAEESIASVERGLNGITRALNDTEQKTAEHIRESLKQAKAALATGDVEGASTLAAKAKALLDELNR